jgi:hypothetical protein
MAGLSRRLVRNSRCGGDGSRGGKGGRLIDKFRKPADIPELYINLLPSPTSFGGRAPSLRPNAMGATTKTLQYGTHRPLYLSCMFT